MLYTIQQLPGEPIFVVRIKAPLQPGESIYAIDETLLRMTAHMSIAYRIDDLRALRAHQFTRSNAYEWFCGPIREDARWRSHVKHVAVCPRNLYTLAERIERAGATIEVPLFTKMSAALAHSRQRIAQ